MVRPIKISEVTPVYPPYRSGMGAVAQANALTLTGIEGAEVSVFTPWYGQGERHEVEGAVTVHRLTPWLSYGNAAVLLQLAWRLRSFDVIHLHVPFIGSIFAVLFALMTSRAKLVVTYHMDLVGAGGWKYPVFRWYNKLVLPLLLRSADRVIVTSQDYAEHSYVARDMALHPQKYVAVPLGVDESRFYPAAKSPAILRSYGIGLDESVFLFVGGLDSAHYFKGVERLIEAWELLRSVVTEGGEVLKCKLIIVGDGDLRPRYESLVKKYNLESAILFAGSVSNEELPLYYQLTSCVVLPSVDRSEAFGVVLLEGMASSCAVIASSLPGVRSVVEDGKTGILVDSQDLQSLAGALADLARHPARRSEMGMAGLSRVMTHYKHEIVSEQLRMIFRQVYENPGN